MRTHKAWRIRGYGAWTRLIACRPFLTMNWGRKFSFSWKHVDCKLCLRDSP